MKKYLVNENQIVHGVDSNKYSDYTGDINSKLGLYGVGKSGSNYSNFSDAEIQTLRDNLKAANDKLAADTNTLTSLQASYNDAINKFNNDYTGYNSIYNLGWGVLTYSGSRDNGSWSSTYSDNNSSASHLAASMAANTLQNNDSKTIKQFYDQINNIQPVITADKAAIASAQAALDAANDANAKAATDPTLIAAKAAADAAATKAASDAAAAKAASDAAANAVTSATSTKKIIYVGLGIVAIVGIAFGTIIMLEALKRHEAVTVPGA